MLNKCGTCDLTLKVRTDPCVQCHACKLNFHEKCSGLSTPEFAVVSKKSSLRWFCRMCDSHVTDVLTNFEKFKKMNAELKAIRDDIDKKLNDFDKRLKSCEQLDENQNIRSTIKKVVQETMPSNDAKEEADLIEKKKSNLIFFKIPENTNEDVETRIKHDYDCLTQIFGEQNTEPTDIANIFRVGKKNEERPRPLIVKFNDVQTKQKYCRMSFGKTLKLRADNEIINVAVAHDKTKKQREESKNRFEQKRARNQNEGGASGSAENFRDAREAPKPSWATVLRTIC